MKLNNNLWQSPLTATIIDVRELQMVKQPEFVCDQVFWELRLKSGNGLLINDDMPVDRELIEDSYIELINMWKYVTQ